MIRRILKWIAIGSVTAILIGVTYLALQPDPGPYLIALRSDTPEQVEKALGVILADDTVVTYDGAAYPAVSTEDLIVLGQRYFQKASGNSLEPLKGDTAVWIGFARRVAEKLRSGPAKTNS